MPDYKTVGREGPDHAPHFTVAVGIEGWDDAEGGGSSKRAAERAAAEAMLARVGLCD